MATQQAYASHHHHVGGITSSSIKSKLKDMLQVRHYNNRVVFENSETRSCLMIIDAEPGGKKEINIIRKDEESKHCQAPFILTLCEVIFGFYELLSGTYVALVKDSEIYVDYKGFLIKRVKKIALVPLFQAGRELSSDKKQEEMKYLQLLEKTFSDTSLFYSPSYSFINDSFKYDITNTLQRLQYLEQLAQSAIKAPNYDINDSNWAKADHRFFWNRDLILDLIRAKADEWITPFMSGFVEFRHNCNAGDQKMSMLFISRRSRYNQGCRYTKRGLDSLGNPANFAETEQILIISEDMSSISSAEQGIDGEIGGTRGVRIKSFVQIRGSIPVLWSSPVTMKYDPVVSSSFIDKNETNANNFKTHHADKTLDFAAAERHINEMLDIYSDNEKRSALICVNLIDKKKDQQKLGNAFDTICKSFKAKNEGGLYEDQKKKEKHVEYIWWDFHRETKLKGKWKNLAKLVIKTDSQLKSMGYFDMGANGKILKLQIGVFRTNCMDNLDRTNVVQSLFARRALMIMLGHQQQLLSQSSKGTDTADVTETPYVLDSPWPSFEIVYKSVWANNANAMSLGYAGTGALKVDFTKTGKRTFKGMIDDGVNSCVRYYLNNFADGSRQDGIDLMLGKFQPDLNENAPSPFLRNARPDQLSLPQSITHACMFLAILFSLLLLAAPVISPFSGLYREFHVIAKLKEFYFSESRFWTFFSIYGEFRTAWEGSYSESFGKHVVTAWLLTTASMGYGLFIILKKGSGVGERLVNTPCLIPYNKRPGCN